MIERLFESPETLRLIAIATTAGFAVLCFATTGVLIRRERRAKWLRDKINNSPGQYRPAQPSVFRDDYTTTPGSGRTPGNQHTTRRFP